MLTVSMLVVWMLVGLATAWPSLAAPDQPASQSGEPQPPKRKLVVGGDHHYPPFQFLKDGQPSGFNIDLIRAVGQVMGFEVDVRLGPLPQARDDLEQGRIDVLAGMYYSPQRDMTVDFSVPLAIVSPGLFVRKDSPVKTLEDLRGREIIVQEGSVMREVLERRGLAPRIVPVADPTEAMRLLASGKHDAVLLSSKVQGLYFIDKLGLANLREVSTNLPSRRYCFAVPEGNQRLIHRLDEGLRILKTTGKYREIYDRWFGVYEHRQRLAVRAILGVMAVIAALLAASLLWLWSLRRQVRRQTAELRSGEERFRALVEQAPEAILVQDVGQDRFIDANRNAERLFGCSREELLRSGPQRFFAPDQPDGRPVAESMREHAAQALAGESLVFERVIHPLSGGEVRCEVRLVRLPSMGNRLLRASFIDITERKRAEEITRREEERLASVLRITQHPAASFQELLDVALDEIVRLSASKIGYLFFYDETKREFTLHAWSKETMRECAVPNPPTIYRLDQTGIWGELVRQRRSLVINDFQAPHSLKRGHPEGHVKLTRYMTVPVFSEGRVVAVAGVGNKSNDYTDADVHQLSLLMDWFWRIAERRQAEEALRESEERFRALIEQAPEGILVYDDDEGRFVQANRNAERIFGCDREEILHSGLDRFYAPQQPDGRPVRESVEEHIQRGLAGEELTFERIIHPLSGGEVFCDMRVVPLPSVGGRKLRISYIDITDRKRAEEELRKHRDHLEELIEARTAELATANRVLAQRSEQLRGLAHQLTEAEQRERRRIAYVLHENFQQLLVAAKYNVHLLRDKGYAFAADQAIDSLDQAIAVSRSLTVELRPPVLYELGLGPALEWLARQSWEKHELDVRLELDAEAEPASDSLRIFLFEAVRELLLNVAKHAKVDKAEIRLCRSGDQIRLVVADQGAGFDPAQPGGASFGLFSIRERLELLGGQMEIESTPGRGTCVTLIVPIREPGAVSRAS